MGIISSGNARGRIEIRYRSCLQHADHAVYFHPAARAGGRNACRDVLTRGFYHEYSRISAPARDRATYAELCASNFPLARSALARIHQSGGDNSFGIGSALIARRLLPAGYKLDNGTLEFPLTKGDDSGIIANLALNREGEEYSCNVFIPTEKDFTLPGAVRGSACGALASPSQRRHTLEHILEALDAVIRHDVLVGFRALVRINEIHRTRWSQVL